MIIINCELKIKFFTQVLKFFLNVVLYIFVGNIYSITYKDVGNTEFSGIHESGYPTEYMSGSDTILDIPNNLLKLKER